MPNLPRHISNEELGDLLMSRLILAACPVPSLSGEAWDHLVRLFEECEDPVALSVIDWALCFRRLDLAADDPRNL